MDSPHSNPSPTSSPPPAAAPPPQQQQSPTNDPPPPLPPLLLDPLQHPYYSTLPPSIAKLFRNLDDDGVYASCEEAVKSPLTKNFIVDFGGAREEGGEAWCALDVEDADADAVRELLMKRRDLEGFINIRTRWINIFQPYEQRKLVSAITSHYNFSPRLTSVITTPPAAATAAAAAAAAAKSASASANSSAPGLTDRHGGRLRNWRGGSSGHSGNSRDVENGGLQVPAGMTTGVEMQQMHSRTAGRRGMGASAEVGNYMDLAQKLWHWHAVEWGNEYICTGFNHLHSVPTAEEYQDSIASAASSSTDTSSSKNPHIHTSIHSRFSSSSPGYDDDEDCDTTDSEDDDEPDDGTLLRKPKSSTTSHSRRDFDPKSEIHPYGRRVWSWLVLCDDGTVISIHEPLTSISPQDLRKVRTNMLTVFRSLSASSAATSLSSVSIGAGLDDLPFRVPNTESDTVDGGPSLLLYYLFDDWYSTFRFVYERGAPYSTKMSKLRNSMRKDPHLKHLKKLHRITRRLASLKRMMETRKIILENILYRQEKPSASGGGADPGFMGGGGGGAGSVGIGSPGFFPPTVENSIDNLQLFHQQHLLQQQLQQQQQQQQQAAQQTQHQPFRRPSEASPYPHPYPHPRPLALTSMGSPHLLGVRLSPLSITKFERLRDRIRLYVLGELDSLLVEKTELENLTFNLISLKQSQTVEVLTRITIYLTKFTFLFLPLTLVTGYFSMQVREMQDGQRYGVSAFWGAAAVSVVVTLAIIWLVGRKTEETMELGKVWRGVRGWVRRKVGRGGGEERRRR